MTHVCDSYEAYESQKDHLPLLMDVPALELVVRFMLVLSIVGYFAIVCHVKQRFAFMVVFCNAYLLVYVLEFL